MQQLGQNDSESFFQVAGESSISHNFYEPMVFYESKSARERLKNSALFRYPRQAIYSMEWSRAGSRGQGNRVLLS